MSCTTIAIVLSVTGAIAELGGLVLIAREIARDQAQAKRLFARRSPAPRRRRVYPGRQSPPRPLASYGTPDPRELAGQLAAGVANALIVQRKAIDQEIDLSVDLARQEATAADDLLRDNLDEVLTGNLRERVVGAILIATGIALAAAGSVVGTLA